MDLENLTDEEKLLMSIEALQAFFDQLDGPNDVYKQILLETVFEELMKEN